MSVIINVRCPVCHADLTYVHKEDEAWGIISLEDSATAEITVHDGGASTKHMSAHHLDGTWLASYNKRAESMGTQLRIASDAAQAR